MKLPLFSILLLSVGQQAQDEFTCNTTFGRKNSGADIELSSGQCGVEVARANGELLPHNAAGSEYNPGERLSVTLSTTSDRDPECAVENYYVFSGDRSFDEIESGAAEFSNGLRGCPWRSAVTNGGSATLTMPSEGDISVWIVYPTNGSTASLKTRQLVLKHREVVQSVRDTQGDRGEQQTRPTQQDRPAIDTTGTTTSNASREPQNGGGGTTSNEPPQRPPREDSSTRTPRPTAAPSERPQRDDRPPIDLTEHFSAVGTREGGVERVLDVSFSHVDQIRLAMNQEETVDQIATAFALKKETVYKIELHDTSEPGVMFYLRGLTSTEISSLQTIVESVTNSDEPSDLQNMLKYYLTTDAEIVNVELRQEQRTAEATTAEPTPRPAVRVTGKPTSTPTRSPTPSPTPRPTSEPTENEEPGTQIQGGGDGKSEAPVASGKDAQDSDELGSKDIGGKRTSSDSNVKNDSSSNTDDESLTAAGANSKAGKSTTQDGSKLEESSGKADSDLNDEEVSSDSTVMIIIIAIVAGVVVFLIALTYYLKMCCFKPKSDRLEEVELRDQGSDWKGFSAETAGAVEIN